MVKNYKFNKSSIFDDIRSKYILQYIFNNLQEDKLLNVIRYNKNIQNKLNKDINDYKELVKIEIEVFLKENEFPGPSTELNKKRISFDKFDIKYFHIYIDNDKEEIKRNYIIYGDKASKIKIKIDNEIKCLNDLFNDCFDIIKIKFIKFLWNICSNVVKI